MRVPVYLVRSRHGIYYFRWPIPQSLHPLGKASDIKVSLLTRDPREALRLSRHLAYVAETLTKRAVTSEMRYDEIRAVIMRHFKALLDEHREKIDAHGRMSKDKRAVLTASLGIAERHIDKEIHEGHDDALRRFQALYGLSLSEGSSEYRVLKTELQRGFRDYVKAILKYDQSLEGYALDADAVPNLSGPASVADTVPATPLKMMAERYVEEGELGNQWGAKTLGERREQFALLQEIVGAETDARTITPADARKVKEIIMRYPKNRNKDARTRGLDLDAALAVEGVDAISVRTMNVWAKGRRHGCLRADRPSRRRV